MSKKGVGEWGWDRISSADWFSFKSIEKNQLSNKKCCATIFILPQAQMAMKKRKMDDGLVTVHEPIDFQSEQSMREWVI